MSDNVKKHEKKMFEHCGSVPIHVKTLKNRFSSYFGCVLVIALGLSVTPHSYLVEGGGVVAAVRGSSQALTRSCLASSWRLCWWVHPVLLQGVHEVVQVVLRVVLLLVP